MKKKIVVVGSINLDFVALVPRMPIAGETITGQSFATYSGGKGANQAVCASRLGGDVVMIGRVGDDLFATQLLDGLKSEEIETRCVENVAGPSGSAVILVTLAGDNSIVVIPGANHALQPADLDLYLDELRSASLILSQLEIPLDTVERLGDLAKEFGVPFILDPAPARELPESLLQNVTWLTPNESETRILLDGLRVSSDFEPAAAAQHLRNAGVQNVLLKRGSQGVFLSGNAVKDTSLPAFPVKVVDTTAAGDAFNGGFAYALSEGMDPIEAARFASAVAAVSVSKAGAQPSMPKLAEVHGVLGI